MYPIRRLTINIPVLYVSLTAALLVISRTDFSKLSKSAITVVEMVVDMSVGVGAVCLGNQPASD